MAVEDPHAEPHNASDDAEAQARLAAEREELVGARRMRQQGRPSINSKLLTSGAIICTGAFLFILFAGPGAFLQLFSTDDKGQRASEVDMEVGRPRGEDVRLDFVVPARAVVEKKEVDPNEAWNEKFRALQAQLAEMGRNKQTGASNAEIQQMLTRYNESMTEKMEAQRKTLSDENARLREEAARADEQRRRLEDASKLAAATIKDRQALEKAQRESDAVVVDEGGRGMIAGLPAGEGEGGQDDLNANERFLKSAASGVFQTSVSTRLADPARTVVQGTIVSAVLETAIDTQLPGNLRAQVTEPVYAFDGSRVLMPQGTILIGQFNNDVDLAQKRVLIAWNRAITPDGKSVALGSTGTDRLGRSGTEGNVDNRYMTKFGAAALISAITVAPSMLAKSVGGSGSGSGTTINVGGSGGSAGGGGDLASSISGSLGKQTSGVVEDYLKLPPVIRIPQGEEIRIFVNRDLVFR